MINNISEGTMRTAVKIEPGEAIHDRQISQAKSEEIRKARPVENTESGSKAGSKNTQKESSSKYLLEENTVVFEKYNKDGELLYRLPPTYKPVDERV
ncbi:MAG: hypothetical protein HZB87_10690 [Desulfatitalea sp.]|nr:hypothetical protein [Desulfatitalea sp.]